MEKNLEELLGQSGNQPVFPVGTIEKGQGVFLEDKRGDRREITFQGYEHLV